MSARRTLTGAALRLLQFLQNGPVSLRMPVENGSVLLEADAGSSLSVERDLLTLFGARGLTVRTPTALALSAEGLALAKQLRGLSTTGVGGREVELAVTGSTDERAIVLMNAKESPLAQLGRHRTKCGRPFLTAQEFEAGERLRADYSRGRVMPRLGANWVASVSSGKRSGNNSAELTELALAARQRVERAIVAVGPELAGILIDVCCFLKGLETVEMERQWPVRSAKVVLKTALGALARHYAPVNSSRGRPQILHWGREDYRPAING